MFVKGRIWFPLGCPQRRPLTRLMQARPPNSEFEVFCSTEFGFAVPAGVCGDSESRRYVKIIIMQPQIKSPRFINTSFLSGNYWDQHQLPPQKMYESNIFLERFFVVSIKQVGFLFIRINIFTLALQQNRFFVPDCILIYLTFVARQKVFYHSFHISIFFVSGEHN